MAAGIVGTWPPVPNTITYLPSTISPLAGMEPPAFPTAPDLEKTKSGEMENNMLLEVLNHCRMLQTAVQRLEQKIDSLQSNQCATGGCRTQAIPQEGHFGTGQLSSSLAQRLGPSPQTNHRWYPPWKRSSVSQAPDPSDPLQSDQCSFRNSSGTRGGGRGKGRRRDRWGGARSGAPSEQPDTEKLHAKLEPLLDEAFPKKEESQPAKICKKAPHLDKGKLKKKLKKQKKRPAGAESKPKDEVPIKLEDMSTVKEDKKVMIGSASRNVWIPMSVYMHVFKEEEPQKAVVPVLHTLFPISTLSCSAITSDPLRGIQLLDPNKLEALREWLAEMYPQHDMRVRGVAWAQCLGVINSITKDLRRREEISGEVDAPQT